MDGCLWTIWSRDVLRPPTSSNDYRKSLRTRSMSTNNWMLVTIGACSMLTRLTIHRDWKGSGFSLRRRSSQQSPASGIWKGGRMRPNPHFQYTSSSLATTFLSVLLPSRATRSSQFLSLSLVPERHGMDIKGSSDVEDGLVWWLGPFSRRAVRLLFLFNLIFIQWH